MTNLQIGSRGSDVADLQKRLNAEGYRLDVDGAFGAATAAAVRDYQTRHGLGVDGIVGPRTRAALDGGGLSTAWSGGVSYGGTSYGAASLSPWSGAGSEAPLANAAASAPAPYESPYAGKLNTLYEALSSRKPFTYDPEGDALYRHYRNSYVQQGRNAMDDTAGRNAALTGGYGSSYAQSAAQAAYQGYLQKLWDMLPALRDKAYQRYKAEGDEMRSNFKLLTDADKAAYNRYQGYLKQFNADRSYQLKADQQSEKAAYNAARLAQTAAKSASKAASKSASKSTAKATGKTTAGAKTAAKGAIVKPSQLRSGRAVQ